MKRCFVMVMCLLLMAGFLAGCAKETFVWNDILLSENLPTPFTDEGSVHSESDDSLWMELHGVDSSEFKQYVDQCKEYGYTVDAVQSGLSFDAYNQDGYKLKLYFSESLEELSISLDSPMETVTLDWPFHDLCQLLPEPASKQGMIKWEYENKFLVYIANLNKDAFTAYADACANAGFDVDYSKGDTYYRAQNEEGYRLSLSYEGFNTVSVELSSPATGTSSTAATTTTTNNSTDMRSDFKKAMDEYEEFIDEYINFMNRYTASGGADLSLITAYADYVTEYAEMVDAFEKWENEDLSDIEVAYYLDVQTRVSKKLLEAAL